MLEVCGSHIEGAVVVVEIRPSMMPPGNFKTGEADIEAAREERATTAEAEAVERRERETKEKAITDAQAETVSVRQKSIATALLVKHRSIYERQIAEMKLLAAKRLIASKMDEIAQKNHAIAMLKWEKATDKLSKDAAAVELLSATEQLVWTKAAKTEAERKLDIQKQIHHEAQLKLDSMNVKLVQVHNATP